MRQVIFAAAILGAWVCAYGRVITVDDDGAADFSNIQAAPGIQGIVDFELRFQVFEIVREAQAVTAGDGFQAASDGIGINIRPDISRMDDFC